MTKKQVLRLIGLCYGIVLMWNLGFAIYDAAADAIARATGTLQTRTLDFTDFETFQMTIESPTRAVTAGSDPQLILRTPGTRVVGAAFTIHFSEDPGEVTLYYAQEGEEFSSEKKIWGKPKNDGSYVFTLPRTRIDTLRVDPTNQPGLTMELESFTLNGARDFLSYFSFTYEDLFFFLICPGMAAAALAYVLERISARKSRT